MELMPPYRQAEACCQRLMSFGRKTLVRKTFGQGRHVDSEPIIWTN